MINLAHAIRAVRQRLDKTMVEFAEMIGCRQSTVSRYESGKLVPGRSVLILLLQLAQGAERGPILDALGVGRAVATGWAERDLIGALKTFEEYLDLSSAAPRARRRAREGSLAAFARVAKRVVLEGSPVEPALVSIRPPRLPSASRLPRRGAHRAWAADSGAPSALHFQTQAPHP